MQIEEKPMNSILSGHSCRTDRSNSKRVRLNEKFTRWSRHCRQISTTECDLQGLEKIAPDSRSSVNISGGELHAKAEAIDIVRSY